MGVLYVTTNSSNAIFNGGVYFITQRILSMVLLVCILLSHFTYITHLDLYLLLFILVLLRKIGVFPFRGWYQSSVYSFPFLSFFLALTFHKIPLLYILTVFIGSLTPAPYFYCLLVILLVNLVIFGVRANLSIDLRGVILATSIANNIWLVFTCFVGVSIIMSFITIYFILIYFSFRPNLSLSN